VGVFLGYEKRIRLIESPGDKSMSFKFLMGFIRAAKITQPDIVHTNGMYTAMVALFVRKVFKFKYKTIMTLRHTSETFRANWITKRFIPFLNNADMVHYLTPCQKSIYEKRDCDISVSFVGKRPKKDWARTKRKLRQLYADSKSQLIHSPLESVSFHVCRALGNYSLPLVQTIHNTRLSHPFVDRLF